MLPRILIVLGLLTARVAAQQLLSFNFKTGRSTGPITDFLTRPFQHVFGEGPTAPQQTDFFGDGQPQIVNVRPTGGGISSYSRLNQCHFVEKDFFSPMASVCQEYGELIVRKLRIGEDTFWCIGLYKSANQYGDYVDVELNRGYKVEFAPQEIGMKIVGNLRLRFGFVPREIGRVVIFDNGYGFPEILSMEHRGRRICTAQDNHQVIDPAPHLENNIIPSRPHYSQPQTRLPPDNWRPQSPNNNPPPVIHFVTQPTATRPTYPPENWSSDNWRPPAHNTPPPVVQVFTQPTTPRPTYPPENWRPPVPETQPPVIQFVTQPTHPPTQPTTKSTTTQPPPPSRVSSYCGSRLAVIDRVTLVARGTAARDGEWPWHAAIFHTSYISFSYKCGGTIISHSSILTAAHCVVDDGRPLIRERISVHLGKYILKRFTAHSREYEVYNVQVHEKFNPDSNSHDIAILKLATTIEFSEWIQPACLPPSTDFDIEGKSGMAVGWGRNENGQVADRLMVAPMKVVSHVDCLKSNRDFFGQFLNDENFCAGYRNGTIVCTGDSGGGLFFSQDRDTWYVSGIVSIGVRNDKHGLEVCDSHQFAMFTDVRKHLDWIRERL